MEKRCETCGRLLKTGGSVCDGCWEVEVRLDSYLTSPRAREKTRGALLQALRGAPVFSGFHVHRLTNPDNELEARFARTWAKWARENLAWLLCCPSDNSSRPREPSDRDVAVACTVIQWLGTDVGQAFLESNGFKRSKTR